MRRNILIIVVITAAMMELIDTSIVNVALSHMSGNLGSTLEDTSWVITAYAIANVIIIPMTSFLAALLGRRNYYIGSIFLFTFCSLMCGQANSIWMLVVFRFLQGLGGGALLSVSQAIVFELFPPQKRNIASALFGIGVFIGPTIGPTLGGFITEYYSWPWIFYINLPIGILIGILCYALLPEPPIRQTVGKIDWVGIFLLAIGVGALQTFLERGEVEDWFETSYIIWLGVTAFIAIYLFIWRELVTDHPVVNLRVLKSRSLAIAAALTFITGIGMFSSVYLTPVFAQRLLGFTPTQTGLLLLPGALLAIGGLMISAKLMQKGVSPMVMIMIGLSLFALFSWQMSRLTLDASGADITAALLWRGLGLAIITVPLTSVAVSSLNPVDVPQGAALNNMMRQLGGSVGLAMINTYLANKNALHRTNLLTHISDANPALTQRLAGYTAGFLSKGVNEIDAHHKALGLLDKIITRQVGMLSFADAYVLVGSLFMAALPLLLLTGRRKGGAATIILSDH